MRDEYVCKNDIHHEECEVHDDAAQDFIVNLAKGLNVY